MKKPVQMVAAALGWWLAWASALAAPVTQLEEGFQGRFDFRISDAVVLQASLQLPEGPGPFPVVVLMHGGAGVSELERQDVADLVPRGYATVLVDGFTGRGFKPGSGTGAGAALRPFERVVDAYAVLKPLVTHPRIDQDRMVLLGRSHGGTAAIVASTAWAKNRYSQTEPSYKAYVALYPGCNTLFPELDATVAPLRLHLAAQDELTPSPPCVQMVARMRSRGQDAAATVYEGAHHAFDVDMPVTYFGQWLNYGACHLQLPAVDAPLPLDGLRACVKKGTSMGGHPQAASLFRKNLAAELAGLLR